MIYDIQRISAYRILLLTRPDVRPFFNAIASDLVPIPAVAQPQPPVSLRQSYTGVVAYNTRIYSPTHQIQAQGKIHRNRKGL